MLSLSKKTACEDNPNRFLTYIKPNQSLLFLFILLFVSFESIIPYVKGVMLILFSLTDLGNGVMTDRSLQKYCNSR